MDPFTKSVKVIYREINQPSSSNPHPRDAGRDDLVIGNPSWGGWKANRLVALREDNPATWLLEIITEDAILWTPRHRKHCQPFHWSQSRDPMAGLKNLLEKRVAYLATSLHVTPITNHDKDKRNVKKFKNIPDDLQGTWGWKPYCPISIPCCPRKSDL